MKSKTDVTKCGTCEYWTGKRNPIFDAKGLPKVDIVDTIGNCENEKSRFNGKMREQTAKCVRFSKWTELI